MAKVLILAGGTSDEREVSLRSGGSVKVALETMNHQVGVADPASPNFDLGTVTHGYDVVFSVLHGKGGEDGLMQAELDKTGVPYVGTGTAASELCFDKWRYRSKLLGVGVSLPKGELVDIESFWQSPLTRQPFVLKPFDGGSSIDTLIVREPNKLEAAVVNDIFTRHAKMLLEELIEGIEITVSVLGDTALPVIEIIPPESGEFDYENKYNGASQELCPPVNVPKNVQREAQSLAARIHELCDCRDYSRTDMIVGDSGELAVLETNTLPGMTDQSLFPKAGATAGITMPELCDRLVTMALNRTGNT